MERWRGRERRYRDLAVMCNRFGTADTNSLFRPTDFLADNSFRADAQLHFVNHHEAHALAALFYTDWDDALVYTSDGVGDNVSYSMRSLKDGVLTCHYGDDRWLTTKPNRNGIASAYGYATQACGFRMLRHEGKLTGLAAYGEPDLAERMAACFRFNETNGQIESDFADWDAIGRAVLAVCKDQTRETIAASIQQVAEDYTLRSVRLVGRAHRRAASGAGRRAVRQCPAQSAARRTAADRRDLHLSGDGRRRPVRRRRPRPAARSATAPRPGSAIVIDSTTSISARISTTASTPRSTAAA